MNFKTELDIDGPKLLINGKTTYDGITYQGFPVEGLLFNSRMVQAIMDDENQVTRELWKYPDTGLWDPERNTNEFCAQLPVYRQYGLLGVTLGLQGGGSDYRPEVWDNARFSAFDLEGNLKKSYTNRLLRVLKAADESGMVVIVNFFYWKQVRFIKEDCIIEKCLDKATQWLLESGYRNILVDIANECADWWGRPILAPGNMHRLIDRMKGNSLNGRRLLVSSSTGGCNDATDKWLAAEDFSLPHGNMNSPGALKLKLLGLKKRPEYIKRPIPIIINEDSTDLKNLEVAFEEYVSWGFYAQGAGSHDPQYEVIWKRKERETTYEELSGFQVLPVNWSINTEIKRAFFSKVKEITQGK